MMTSLGIVSSFSRPRVSDDNPFIEALFRTLKYRPDHPTKRFQTMQEAVAAIEAFVRWYNHDHLHSAIGFVTPQARHVGADLPILAHRRLVYYIIRFRAAIQVEAADGTSQRASAWLPDSGRATMIPDARVTRTRAQVPAVVVVHAARMKEAWCLATSLKDQKPAEVVKLYGRRFTIEETFRDQKDLRFGLGLSATHIGSPDRRDRMLLLAAIAQALLTLLGAAGEACGLDRLLKTNTSKKRQLSLLNQGMHHYDALPNMREDRLVLLMTAFDAEIRRHAIFPAAFGLI
jgi:hypothetical protein